MCLIQRDATNACGEKEVEFFSFLTSVLDFDEWSVSGYGRLTPQSHRTAGSAGPHRGLVGCLEERDVNSPTLTKAHNISPCTQTHSPCDDCQL